MEFIFLVFGIALLSNFRVNMNENKTEQNGNTKTEQKEAIEKKETIDNATKRIDTITDSNIKPEQTFINPVRNFKITSNFGERIDPIWKKNYIEKYGIEKYKQLKDSEKPKKFHNGIDLISDDLEILSATNGTVTRINEDVSNIAGKYIEISFIIGNDVFNVIYCHLASVGVKIKQKIEAGQTIGIMGKTGRATGIHLHYIIKKNAKYENPINYLTVG